MMTQRSAIPTLNIMAKTTYMVREALANVSFLMFCFFPRTAGGVVAG